MIKRKVPSRKCIGCNEMKEKKELLRIIKTPEEEILLDRTGKNNGRGAYICYSIQCLEKAKQSKALERSLKIAIPAEVYEQLEKELNESDGK